MRGTGMDEHTGILGPALPIEVDGDEIARISRRQRIDACNDIAAQVLLDHEIGNSNERLVAAVSALDSGLVAHTAHPFIGTGRRISGLA
ncbi:MAG: hypothetical protein ABI145_14865 [Steroidobacteraceae bacterium]